MDRNIITLLFVVVGSFLAIASAYVQYKDKKEADDQSKKSKQEVSDANKRIISLNEEVKEKTNELLIANEKINELTNETLKIALGNGILEIDLLQVTPTDYEFRIINNSTYPIYDASIEFIDFDELIKCPKETINGKLNVLRECYQKTVFRIKSNNFIPRTEKYSKPRFKFVDGYKHYLIKIHSRNSTSLRQCIFKVKDNGLWLQSYRLYEFANSSLKLTKEINPLKVENDYWNIHFFKDLDFTINGYQ